MGPAISLYALDDLHRITAILCTQQPDSGSYEDAKEQTSAYIGELETPREGLAWLLREVSFLGRKSGQQKSEKAVQLYRAARNLELAFDSLSALHQSQIAHVKETAAADLRARGVPLPDDLSFCP
jgi:hypothetical protein